MTNETKAAHTPGPWRKCGANSDIGGCVCGLIWATGADFCVATVERENEESGAAIPEEMRQANANLISAAPDLLAALESSVAALNGLSAQSDSCVICSARFAETHVDSCALRVGRAAIAKARGES